MAVDQVIAETGAAWESCGQALARLIGAVLAEVQEVREGRDGTMDKLLESVEELSLRVRRLEDRAGGSEGQALEEVRKQLSAFDTRIRLLEPRE